MPRKKLRFTLDELNRQLGEVDHLDEENRTDLAAIATKIAGLLNEDTEAEEEREGLIDRVREADARFGGEHPLLSATLRRIADTLTQIGV